MNYLYIGIICEDGTKKVDGLTNGQVGIQLDYFLHKFIFQVSGDWVFRNGYYHVNSKKKVMQTL